jgi:hypothetical protein
MTHSLPKVIGIIILLIVSTIPAWAGNSIFSFNGLPNQYYGNDIYGFTMGDTGMADAYRINTGFGNPALLARTRNAVFSTGIMVGDTWYEDNLNHKYTDNSLDFPYFSFVIPIASHKFGFQFQSLSSGVVKDQTYVPADTLHHFSSFTEYNSIDSYLYRVDFMYSYPFKYFDFGVGLNYYLGHENRSISQDSGNSPFNTIYSITRSYQNPGFSVGLLKKTDRFSTAFTYNSATTLKGDTEFRSIQLTESESSAKYQLPNRFGMGLTLNHNDLVRTNYEFHYDMWKSAKNDENTSDSWKAGIGITYDPMATGDSFLKKIPLRGGFSWRRLPFEKNNASIDEKAASFGFSIPLKAPQNRIDLGFQYSMRGDKSKNLVQESSLMMMFGISGFDIFTREPRRTVPRDIPKVEEIQ